MDSNKLNFSVLLMVVCLTQVGADIYAPSIPAIALSLQTRTAFVEWSMALYMLGVALSHLIYGPLSEGIGRKIPILIGLWIMLGGTLICLWAENIEILNIGRFIQGSGAGACACLWRSIFRDKFKGEDLSRYSSYLVVFIMFLVPAAPLLGSFLQDFFDWRASFVFMSFYAVICLFSFILFFRETNQSPHKEKLKLSFIARTYLALFTNRLFIGTSLCTFLSYGGFFTWFTAGPALLIEGVGITPTDFGLITFFGGGCAYGLSGWLNGKFVSHYGMTTLLRFGWATMMISAILLLMGYIVLGMNAWAIIGPVILFYFGSTFIWPNTFATAFMHVGEVAGYAGALYGFMQISGAAVLSWGISFLPNSPISLGVVILGTATLSWIIYELSVPFKYPSRLATLIFSERAKD